MSDELLDGRLGAEETHEVIVQVIRAAILEITDFFILRQVKLKTLGR